MTAELRAAAEAFRDASLAADQYRHCSMSQMTYEEFRKHCAELVAESKARIALFEALAAPQGDPAPAEREALRELRQWGDEEFCDSAPLLTSWAQEQQRAWRKVRDAIDEMMSRDPAPPAAASSEPVIAMPTCLQRDPSTGDRCKKLWTVPHPKRAGCGWCDAHAVVLTLPERFAELERERDEAGRLGRDRQWERMLAAAQEIRGLRERAEAAERERDDLRAKLAAASSEPHKLAAQTAWPPMSTGQRKGEPERNGLEWLHWFCGMVWQWAWYVPPGDARLACEIADMLVKDAAPAPKPEPDAALLRKKS